MSELAFWKAAVQDRSNFLERILALLAQNGIRYCVIGGVAVNAYSEPVVTLDLDVVVAADQVDRVRQLVAGEFRVRELPYSLNVYDPGSRLQVQVQLRPGLDAFVDRAQLRSVLDLVIPVAAPEDLLQAKLEAALDPTRRPSKRLKDFADIRRLVDAFPDLGDRLPAAVRERIFL